MQPSRYQILDAYTLQELRREYETADASGRIRLLRKLQANDRVLPQQVAVLAAEDSQPGVRAWIARHGKLFDTDDSDKEIIARLKNDPDPYVRACLRENPSVFFGLLPPLSPWAQYFAEASHLERLALVRNPKVYEQFIEQVFDPDDTELGIQAEARRELVLAFLTNKEKIFEVTLAAGLRGERGSLDGGTHYSAGRFFTTLWELASKWPPSTRIPGYVYRYLPADDATKASIYGKVGEPGLRALVLENSDSRDIGTVQLAMKDSDDTCRLLAYSKVRHLSQEAIEALLRGDDTDALSGLARNESMPAATLERVRQRLSELGDDIGWAWAFDSMEKIQKTRPPEDAEELFGYDGRQGDFTQDKIDFIGKRIVAMQEGLERRLQEGQAASVRFLDSIHTMVGWVLLIVAAMAVIRLLAWLF